MTNDFSKYGFIFDMDGTLVDNMRFHMRAWTAMLAENGIENDGRDFLVNTAGKTNREIIPQFFPNVSDADLKRLGDRKEELYRALFKPELRAIAGAVAFLEESKKLGIKMAVATAAPVENMEFILDGLDLRKYFHAITTAADVQNGKPDPEVFLISAEKLGVETQYCIVFEDALNGFEAAKRAGMSSVGIATVNSIDEILALPLILDARSDFCDLDPQELIAGFVPNQAKAN